MATIKEIYVKHQSFETFISNINADCNAQRVRVITNLRECLGNPPDLYDHKVYKLALADLLLPESQTVGFKITPYISDELSKLPDNEIGRYIFHRYRYDVYPKKKILDAYPPYLQIEPTSVCNYRCVFCYQSDESFSEKANGYMGSMSLDLFKGVIDQIVGKVEFMSLASRGEPLIAKDVDRMLEYCAGKFLGLKINTNASLLNEKHCHAILAGGINTVVFSADAAKEPLYSQLRVKGDLNTVLKNIRLFNTIRAKHYPQSKIISRVSGVKVNDEQDMSSMKGLWGDLVDQVAFVVYNPWENVYESPVNTLTTPCSDLWRRMFVWYNGKVNPCDTDYKSTLSVGEVQKSGISQVWRSAGYDALRKRHQEKERSSLEPCRRCTVV